MLMMTLFVKSDRHLHFIEIGERCQSDGESSEGVTSLQVISDAAPDILTPSSAPPSFPSLGAACAVCVLSCFAAAKSPQSCPTLCDPTDGSPPGSPVPGILQARTLEWVAVSFSNAGNCFSRVQLFASLWTVARRAPLSMGFPRHEYWSGLPRAPPGDHPNPVIKPTSLLFCTGQQALHR